MENGVDDHNDGDWLQDDPPGDIARPIPHTLPEPYTQEIHKSWQVRRQVDDSSFEQLALIGIVFLGLKSTNQAEKEELKRKRCPFEDGVEEARTERHVALRRMDAVAELQ
jgi:hypothetical protein